ncbi:MAG: CorA family divalent cation transporter [Candidatus Micrarchaeota archaeon]
MENGGTLDKRFFYVAQMGSIQTQACADLPDEFMPKINEAKVAWLDYLVDSIDNESEKIAEKFGFSKRLVQQLLKNRKSGYEDYDTEMGLKIPAIIVKGLEVKVSPVMVLINERAILTIHSYKVQRFIRFRRYADAYLKKIPINLPANDRITLLLCRLLDENNSRNFDHLREIEEQGDNMSKWMMDPDTPRSKLGPEIYKMKHSLIMYLNALWDSLDVLNFLLYGDAKLMTDNQRILDRIELLSNNVNRQIELSEHMSEVLASGLEVLQSIYNNQLQVLNNRMAFAMTYLTILGTAVLVPNTIATVMSNPAYNMTPKDVGWYSALMVLTTILSTLFAYMWVRKQGWFPKQFD